MTVDENALRQRAALGSKYKEHLEDFHAAIDAVEAQYASICLGMGGYVRRRRAGQSVARSQGVPEDERAFRGAGLERSSRLAPTRRA
jgi:hypothetical protein